MQYRAEIDGLRAVAIIPVILFHAGFPLFSGGFVGVDIFFVISGYLITTIILTEKEQGKFSLINFYERRARRILPALFFVMLVSLPFAWLWLIPSDMKDFSQSLIGVATFSSNILFWQETGYWGTANELKPLLHTWSLAVEEQYYIIFPLYLMLMWRFRKRWILSSFMVIAVISLALAQWGAYNYQTATFFLLPTRGWELAIGASIAFYFLYRKKTIRTLLSHRFIDETLGLVGLLMIGYAVFIFDKTIPFPSVYALIPTVGTALIILFSSSQTVIGRLLGTKILVSIGLISYSTYLWHQPLFAFARNRSLTNPSEILYVVLAIFSIMLGYLSWRYIENPFRAKGIFKRKTIFMFSAIGTVLFITIGLAGHYTEGFQNRFEVKQSILDDFLPNNLRNNCGINADPKRNEINFCTLGTTIDNIDLSFAVLGDSHSSAILPAFDSAAQKNNTKYVHSGLGGCLPLLGVDVASGNYSRGVCENLASKQFEYIKNNGIKKVFLVARWSLYTEKGTKGSNNYLLVDKNSKTLTREASRTVFARGIENTIEAYQSIGVNIFIVLQVPQQKVEPETLYYKLSKISISDDIIINQSISRNYSNHLQAYNRKVFEGLTFKNVKIINLDEYYCNDDVCLIGDKNHSYYLDKDHISISGANLVTDEIIKYIK